MANIFSTTDPQFKTQADIERLLGLGRNTVVRFPSSLSTPVNGQSIPFTIFGPYKRELETFYSQATGSGDPNQLYTDLPTPTFAIVLPTPTSALRTDYRVTYGTFEVGQAVGELGGKLASAARSAISNPAAAVRDLGSAFTGAGVRTGLGVLSGSLKTIGIESGEDAATTALGVAKNPYSETVFRNVEPREHTFSYVFMPKSLSESQTVDNIISLFKYTMLPRPSGLPGGFFEFPFEFQIVHSTQDTTFQMLPSVLTSLDVDYGGGTDSPKFFVSSANQNYPAKISLTMTFREMVLLTRDRLVEPDNVSFTSETTTPRRFRF